MKVKLAVLIFLWAAMGSAVTALAVSVKTQTVTYKSGNETVKGFLALPASRGKHPGLVVIHEWWGLNDWVRAQAVKLAGQGYAALAVDLYRGRSTTDPEVAHELSRGVPHDRALRDLKAAYEYLASRPDVEKNKIGSIGWCMGGGYSLDLAMNEPALAACVVNYGAMPASREDIEKINAPVLGNFGALDRGITPEDVHTFEKAMKSLHKQINVKIYPDAGHAFENPHNKAGYKPGDTTDAWMRITTFLRERLMKKG